MGIADYHDHTLVDPLHKVYESRRFSSGISLKQMLNTAGFDLGDGDPIETTPGGEWFQTHVITRLGNPTAAVGKIYLRG